LEAWIDELHLPESVSDALKTHVSEVLEELAESKDLLEATLLLDAEWETMEVMLIDLDVRLKHITSNWLELIDRLRAQGRWLLED
jgi:hypothetical protein